MVDNYQNHFLPSLSVAMASVAPTRSPPPVPNSNAAPPEPPNEDSQEPHSSESDSEQLSPSASDQPGDQRQKHKRRSKHDLSGRDFRCGCGKRYLSYPALYTHIKTKHAGHNPNGTNAPQYQKGRGRGRPRKVC